MSTYSMPDHLPCPRSPRRDSKGLEKLCTWAFCDGDEVNIANMAGPLQENWTQET
jgi:hypothetical protein